MAGKGRLSRGLVVVVAGAVIWSGVPVAAAAAPASDSVESGGAWPDVSGHVTSVAGGVVGWFGGLFSAGEEVSEEPGPAGADEDRSGSAALPREEPSSVGESGGAAERVREVVSERSANAAVFELSNGQFEAEISTDPVNFRDGDGKWQQIDTTVVATGRDGFAFENAANRFGSLFGARSDQLVRFEVGNRSVTIGLPGERRELEPQADGDMVSYADVFGSADVQYRVSSEGVKKEIILEEAPEEASFTFTMRMGGVVAREMGDGSIGFFSPGKELAPVFRIPKPFMYDSADEPGWSDAVTQQVTQTGSSIEVTVSADEQWLAGDERVYPVVIDPTIIVEPTPTQGQDAMIRQAAPNTNYGASWQLGVGTDSVGAARSLLKFDVSWLPAGAVINTAHVKVWYDQGYYTNANSVSLQLRRVIGAWSESSITWNGFSGLGGELISSVTKASYVNSVWHSYNAKPLVQGWVDGSIPNYGVLLRAQYETTLGRGGAYYEASEYAYNGGPHVNRPKLVISYGQPSVMVEPITTFYATGAELKWSAYAGSDIAEYQVHRSIWQTFTPSAATLVAPVATNVTSFTDTTAAPTPADDPDPFGNAYYYQVAVKLTNGTILQGNTELARLPKAGRVKKIIRGAAVDTTLSSAHPTTNFDTFDGEPWLGAGDNGGSYGRTRTLVKFPDLGGHIPAGATVLDADLKLWKPLTFGSGARFNLHALTRGFDETTATWNRASSGTAWSTPGGDYSSTVVDYVPSMTTDPKFHIWWIEELVQQWVDTPSSNHGALIKIADEAAKNQLSVFLSNEVASEPQLRPQLHVTYLVPTAESTYYAPATPKSTTAGEQRTVPVTVTNTTDTVLTSADHVLSYHWAAADGTDVTSSANRLETVLPANLAPGESVTVNAAVKAPQLTEPTNKREEFTLSWDVRNTGTGQWMSQSRNIPALDQSASVANPTSNQIGLEKFYQYTGTGTGAGSAVLNNLYAGNTVWSYDAFSNPSRGVSTSVRMAYNSLDTSNSAIGYGWSLSTSSVMRMGTPLDFHPRGQQWPSQVTLTDGDGTGHLFTLNKNGSTSEADWTYDSPHGVHLYLQKTGSTDLTRAWVMTAPDRTKFYFDADGYQTALADRNGNELVFTYENRKSNNKPIKFLRYLTDPHNRQTLTVDYYAKGQNYPFIDDTGAVQQGTNLTNPKIIDQVKTLTDISGRTVEFVYTDEGLLGRMTDGAGDPAAKVFGFGYDAEQGNKNVKLVSVTDPRGNTTALSYFEAPTDPKAKWLTETITDRAGGVTTFAYVDPDGPGGDAIETTVTDAKTNATFYRMDGFGRPVLSTNANGETTQLSWDGDHNVVRLVEDNGAVTSWTYDQNTGYPTLITDAEANANSTAGTVLEYAFSLDGHVADLVAKTSPEGRRWAFGYDSAGNLTRVTDPAGTATTNVPDDYTTTYTYNPNGTLATATDANGHTTTYAGYGPTGYPGSITDPLNNAIEVTYDSRGNVTAVTDAAGNTSSYSYDVFGRLGESQVPKDADAGIFIVTPAPVYDGNDNITRATAPNGAVTTYDYDAADRMVSTTLPKDDTGDPDRVASYAYDLVGNLIAETEPNGTLTAANSDDFVTRYGYDAIYQLISVTNAAGDKLTYAYDSVGNVVEVVDPRKNASADPDDVTTTSSYDLNHRVTAVTDAASHTAATSYDLDGMVVETTDKQGATTQVSYDPRGLVAEVRVPHDDAGGSISYRTTRYVYDQAGNRTKVITPRGVATTNTADDFVHQTVYDGLNRVIEQIHPYDPADPVFNTPDKTVYAYDTVGNLTSVSASPSGGQTVRNTTTYQHFDNGWIKSSTDAWEITTSYEYNELGQQILRTLTSSGGSSSRSMSWAYTPDGKLAGRGDDGVPVGEHVVLVDDSDVGNVETIGSWTAASSTSGYYGIGYRHNGSSSGGTGSKAFTWRLHIPADGTYEVFVRYTQHSNRATNAPYTIVHDGGQATRLVKQTTGGGQWVSVGSYGFTRGGDHEIRLSDDADGYVIADAVMLVRDTTGETDAEAKDIAYAYDANGNLTGITDTSSGAQVDAYEIDYTGLNQVKTVEELVAGSVANTTSFTYDANGNPLTTTHDNTYAEYAYDVRDLVEQVTNAGTPSDPDPQVTGYAYTPNGWTATEAKPNGNTVTSEYYLDGLLKHQVETKTDGTTVVAEHTLTYTTNGHRATDVARTRDADTGVLNARTYTYSYDPRDRIAQVRKTDTSSGATLATETYRHDPASNVIEQTIDGTTTAFVYDRNRLLTATTGGVTAAYNYDPFGRLNTVTAAGQAIESYSYDGFDRITQHESLDETGATESTSYSYDPLDRTTSRTDAAGETTDYNYLGLSSEVLNEEIAGQVQKSYQYSPWGKRLSQITHHADGTEEDAYYGYNPHTDVEVLTDQTGDPVTTYGYTAYGKNDEAEFTGLDAPDAGTPSDEPYNVYRYNAKRWDPASGSYDMGFRDYNPGINRFLSRDMYTGALNDLNLGLSPWTNNRYAFTGGNPITLIEHDGHEPRPWHDSDFDSDTFDYGTYWEGERRAYGCTNTDGVGGCGKSGTGTVSKPTTAEWVRAQAVMNPEIPMKYPWYFDTSHPVDAWTIREANHGPNRFAHSLASWKQLDCTKGNLLVICPGWSPAGDRLMVIGDFLFYPHAAEDLEDHMRENPGLFAHEVVHSEQWARDGWWMPVKYGLTSGGSWLLSGNAALLNPYENEAGLREGGYSTEPARYSPMGLVRSAMGYYLNSRMESSCMGPVVGGMHGSTC